jgi:hypothetical protein
LLLGQRPELVITVPGQQHISQHRLDDTICCRMFSLLGIVSILEARVWSGLPSKPTAMNLMSIGLPWQYEWLLSAFFSIVSIHDVLVLPHS